MVSTHLDVDICPVTHEELQAEGPVARSGGEMERRKALLVHLVHVGAALDELVHHRVLPVVARHVEGRVAVRVGLIDLHGEMKQGFVVIIITPPRCKKTE